MQPNSRLTARPQADMSAPINHRERERPMLPTVWKMRPGVANIPEPMILEIMSRYAESQVMLRPWAAASGIVVTSVVYGRMRAPRSFSMFEANTRRPFEV